MKLFSKAAIIILMIAMTFTVASCSNASNEASSSGSKGTTQLAIDKETPLTLEFIDDGEITIANPWSTLKYSRNGGSLTAVEGASISVKKDDKIAFYAVESETERGKAMKINCSSDCYIYGNIMSLVTLDAASNNWNPSATELIADYCFYCLFYSNSHIKNHSEKSLLLPATTISSHCYESMFAECTSLTSAPALPATDLSHSYACYSGMFSGCTSLKSAPELRAKDLYHDCYSNMFSGCSSLTKAPSLPATILISNCYYGMFAGCVSLTSAPDLPAKKLEDCCYYDMFNGCSSLENPPEISATTLAGNCYGYMFEGCTSLKTIPQLPVTTLAYACYQGMFKDCTSITTAELPAAELTDYCYYSMFEGCSKLNNIKCLATDISADYCTDGWVEGVAASGTFVKAASMNGWSTGTSGIPKGWDVQ